jgi:hypothetical protein
MEMEHKDEIQEMTQAIRARLLTQWEAWKNQDPVSNDAVIADEFDSFSPDGLRHTGKPTAEQMAAQPIAGYKLSQFRAVPVGADAALVTYFAEVTIPGDKAVYAMAVGEFWVKRTGQWFIRGFSGTAVDPNFRSPYR